MILILGNVDYYFVACQYIFVKNSYNKINQTDGSLFRGRFKSIIVEADNYLLRLGCYIHLNPVKGKFVNKAEDYKWSSCAAYLGLVESPDWLQTSHVLSRFGNKLQQQKYKLFLKEGDDNEITSFFKKLKLFLKNI